MPDVTTDWQLQRATPLHSEAQVVNWDTVNENFTAAKSGQVPA